MKKLNSLFSMLFAISILLWGCSEKDIVDEKIDEIKTVSIDLKLTKAINDTNLKAGGLGEEEDYAYCDEPIPIDGYVEVEYSASFDSGSPISGTWQKEYSDADWDDVNGLNTMTDLFQIDFPAGATECYLEINSFMVYNNASDRNLLFATPEVNSAYEGYVAEGKAVSFSETINLYEKQFIEVEVLCFNMEAIPLFGFSWLDFEIITGDEVCMFFNCMGTTPGSYHQVFAADFQAQFYNENTDEYGTVIGWTTYWDGANYTEATSTEAFCIPMPGNWKDEGVKLLVNPVNSVLDDIVINLTSEQIQAFLDGTEGDLTPAAGDSGYSLSVDAAGEEEDAVPFLHYTMDHCDSNKAYFVNTNYPSATNTTYYKINYMYDETTEELSSFSIDPLTINASEPYNTLQHIALSKDQSTLYSIESRGASIYERRLFVIDTYTGDLNVIRPEENNAKERGAMLYAVMEQGIAAPTEEQIQENIDEGYLLNYDFQEFLYVDGQLYAACQAAECLVPINIANGMFTYGADIILNAYVNEDDAHTHGGDLLASGDKTLYSFTTGALEDDKGTADPADDVYTNPSVVKVDMDGNTSTRTEISDLDNVTGACMLVDANNNVIGILTSHWQPNVFKFWRDGGVKQTISSGSGLTISNSDLASWNNSWAFDATTFWSFIQ